MLVSTIVCRREPVFVIMVAVVRMLMSRRLVAVLFVVLMGVSVSVVVVMIRTMRMLVPIIGIRGRAAGGPPQADGTQRDQREQGDAAPQNVNVQVVGKDEPQDVLVIEHHGHASEHAANADRAKLLHVIGAAVFVVRMTHRYKVLS